ncbi:aspartate--tRNA ligase [Murimonas intestini]|uniref:aspartate--tRNA ligase n=1 Tax=Murimonas intestini TaxID=1337051 RepID=UPI0011DDDB51|nr:aspartate--tRNA ligase [Murimonas intestini]
MMQSRTHTCGELRKENIGRTVTLAGWYENLRKVSRNLGFLIIRDFYGVTQVVIETEEMMRTAEEINCESTISVTGTVRERSNKNREIPTGEIEVVPEKIELLGHCRYNELPFEIRHSKEADENARLKYRYLDLRNPRVKDNIILRSKVTSRLRERMTGLGFMEITTPILTASSPEGARDYLVPSRNFPGKFYALPQAPQQFKQLLMASGFDRYFQIAPCFRDEDARADRSPGEFYQLDMEMAFASQEDVFSVMEEVLAPVFSEFGIYETVSKPPFRRIPYREAMEKYGSDKPDLRISLVLEDISDDLRGCSFSILGDEGAVVKAVVIKGFRESRRFIDETCAQVQVQTGRPVYWFRVNEAGGFTGGVSKHLTGCEDGLRARLSLEPGDLVCMAAGDKLLEVQKTAGVIRKLFGTKLDSCIDRDKYGFCWIVDFPMYEISEETGKLVFCHNPFSMPQGGMEALLYKEPLEICAYQYDLVCNGTELSSGAVRNHDPDIMVKAFELAGMGEEDVKARFPAMYSAFCYGAPPHAGIAPGVDRMVMLLCGEENIREIIPFPMNSRAQDLMCQAPGEVSEEQLEAVHIVPRDMAVRRKEWKIPEI